MPATNHRLPRVLGTDENPGDMPPCGDIRGGIRGGIRGDIRGDINTRWTLCAKASAPTPCFAIRTTVGVPPFNAETNP
jgi:hypothetical protein